MWLPFIMMIAISRYLLTHKDSKDVKSIFALLRPTIIGLIASAAVLLMNKENFGSPSESLPFFILNLAFFLTAFCAVMFKKANPIIVMLIFGLLGLIIY